MQLGKINILRNQRGGVFSKKLTIYYGREGVGVGGGQKYYVIKNVLFSLILQ